ncbi:uncharacterized protein MELLADRAFT_115182 [Melampsora larici-populina 98AG31]|uniref:Uncharacterized protein n=1 Tax=Melampsora larici-populina (strain 98AG31 / pathotype 3-4-7) TaxID=747676 RepID=F4R7C4_MELLP|nr:uncharacterized protein MELLADRAFT_115182 [Melampsora larici-populina 98AG31]EGG11290.1 hypothetical protein MELLADRAFT_115182 [Melampsora larici-populina 98AG31]
MCSKVSVTNCHQLKPSPSLAIRTKAPLSRTKIESGTASLYSQASKSTIPRTPTYQNYLPSQNQPSEMIKSTPDHPLSFLNSPPPNMQTFERNRHGDPVSIYSGRESVFSQASAAPSDWTPNTTPSLQSPITPRTAVSDYNKSPSQSFPKYKTASTTSSNSEKENGDEVQFRGSNELPREPKRSLIDRPRPISRARTPTFSAPHADTDRLFHSVLRTSKSFDRGRRFWLSNPTSEDSLPPVPKIPNQFQLSSTRKSSLVNLSQPHNPHSLNPYGNLKASRTATDLHHQQHEFESMYETAEIRSDINRSMDSMNLFDNRSPCLTLTNPAMVNISPLKPSPSRKGVFPHSINAIRNQLKPRKSGV